MLELTAADVEIADVCTRLASAVDDHDRRTIAASFTSAAHARISGVELVGRDAIADFLAGAVERCGTTRHMLGNPVLDVVGDQATTVADVHIVDVHDNAVRVVVGRARGRLVRSGGRWQLTDYLFDRTKPDMHVGR